MDNYAKKQKIAKKSRDIKRAPEILKPFLSVCLIY